MSVMSGVIIGVLGVGLFFVLYQGWRQEMRALNARVRRLEEAGQKRVNYRSLEELEHAMATLAVYRTQHEFEEKLLETVTAHLERAHTPTVKGASDEKE